eukprot:CAMPEP_0201918832 /NCGR_PEP_ID=MMETSP0903-20130614/7885_1 /ASSEMBLY_ACC=CAM_ASM_000552 /TAXON_ID=420261 /ORGANISM="Thalassiosira antarctica, Strain CCMP982" /LENGTH=143 /DNA_ID=CAMNT_0048455219 /DNA_START=52 /DNA_END=484 /DNA_ORIENTATION=-
MKRQPRLLPIVTQMTNRIMHNFQHLVSILEGFTNHGARSGLGMLQYFLRVQVAVDIVFFDFFGRNDVDSATVGFYGDVGRADRKEYGGPPPPAALALDFLDNPPILELKRRMVEGLLALNSTSGGPKCSGRSLPYESSKAIGG